MTTTIISHAVQQTSKHVANVGDRVRVDGVIRKMIGAGPVLHIIHDADGNEFTLRRRQALARRPGVLVSIEADVLGHSEYRGVARTDLSSGKELVVTDDHPMARRG